MIYYSDTLQVDLILISGGTGPSKRDITPEATKEVIEKELPGFSEAIRIESFKTVKTAILSRGIAGVRGDTLIIKPSWQSARCNRVFKHSKRSNSALYRGHTRQRRNIWKIY